MAITKGFQTIMTIDDTDETFDFRVEGDGLIVMTQVTGNWDLVLVAPDNEEIPLLSITEPCSAMLSRTLHKARDLRFTGDSGARANAWFGRAFDTPEGLLL